MSFSSDHRLTSPVTVDDVDSDPSTVKKRFLSYGEGLTRRWSLREEDHLHIRITTHLDVSTYTNTHTVTDNPTRSDSQTNMVTYTDDQHSNVVRHRYTRTHTHTRVYVRTRGCGKR